MLFFPKQLESARSREWKRRLDSKKVIILPREVDAALFSFFVDGIRSLFLYFVHETFKT